MRSSTTRYPALALVPMSELIRRMIAGIGDGTGARYAAEIDRRLPDSYGRLADVDRAIEERYGDLATLGAVNSAWADTTVERVIDERPCEPLRPEDSDWGETDSLSNVPRKSQAPALYVCEEQEELGAL